MIFKDRTEAGKKLAVLLKKQKIKQGVVVSLLRGGVVVGAEISKKLKLPHLALAVAKIPSPYQSELAVGALCFDFTYLEPHLVKTLKLSRADLRSQIQIAKNKFNSYLKKFNIKKSIYKLKNITVLLVDDGIATGSTVKAALLFVKSFKPKKIILAVPVAPNDLESIGFNKTIILHLDTSFSSVSQFYKDFPQVSDEEVEKIFSLSRGPRSGETLL